MVEEGDEGDFFYIIERGSVDCVKRLEGGGEKHIRTLFEGDGFGEKALISPSQKRTLTVRAKTSCRLLALDKSRFERILGAIQNYLEEKYNA